MRVSRKALAAGARRAAGFTLVETVLTIVVVGIALAAIMTVFAESVGKSHHPYLRQKALAVAEGYMDEILGRRWDENTPIGGGCVDAGSGECGDGPEAECPSDCGQDDESRAEYDDVDDYDAINGGPPEHADGEEMDGYDGFTVVVDVTTPDSNWKGVARQDVKRVEVRVTTSNDETVRLVAYRLNY